jgi:hypothetical protein
MIYVLSVGLTWRPNTCILGPSRGLIYLKSSLVKVIDILLKDSELLNYTIYTFKLLSNNL